MDRTDFVIIGAGPAGEAAAHKARELGASVAVVDRRWFGGSCPHIGCIPFDGVDAFEPVADVARTARGYSIEAARAT